MDEHGSTGFAGCALKHPASLCNTRGPMLHNGCSMTEYRCVTKSIAGFIQQLAVSYVGRGYWFYVSGRVPDGKDPLRVDAKLVERYGIDISKWARARRKKLGIANMQYIRHGRFFVLLATHGRHAFFEDERHVIRDVRRVPVKYAGYAVSYRDGHPHVRIERREYLEVRAWLLDVAAHRGPAGVREALRAVAVEPYAPIRRQLLNLLRVVNRELKARGQRTIGHEVLTLRRTVGPIFTHAAVGSRVQRSEIVLQCGTRCSAARSGPRDELGQVDTPVAGFTVVNPGLRPVQQLGERTLGEPGL